MATRPTSVPAREPPTGEGSLFTRAWIAFFQHLANQSAAAGSGSVTHTGNLTPDQIVLGNGGADLKVLGSYGLAGDVLTSQGVGLPPIFAAASAGVAYMPLTLGDEPPTFVTDGAGRLIMLAFTP